MKTVLIIFTFCIAWGAGAHAAPSLRLPWFAGKQGSGPARKLSSVPEELWYGIPSEERLAGPEMAMLQERLYRDHGILALDKTDSHSPRVIGNLILLLDDGLPEVKLRGIRYLFAYAGHDDTYNIAAYHEQAKAVSIGGKLSYPGIFDGSPDLGLLASLAHEVGHAFLLENLTPLELRDIAATYGGWGPVMSGIQPESLMAPVFFLRHPLSAQLLQARSDWSNISLASEYGAANVHEWFADAFAAAVLQRIGERHALGPGWRERLIHLPKRKGHFWTNYNNISGSMLAWMKRKLGF